MAVHRQAEGVPGGGRPTSSWPVSGVSRVRGDVAICANGNGKQLRGTPTALKNPVVIQRKAIDVMPFMKVE